MPALVDRGAAHGAQERSRARSPQAQLASLVGGEETPARRVERDVEHLGGVPAEEGVVAVVAIGEPVQPDLAAARVREPRAPGIDARRGPHPRVVRPDVPARRPGRESVLGPRRELNRPEVPAVGAARHRSPGDHLVVRAEANDLGGTGEGPGRSSVEAPQPDERVPDAPREQAVTPRREDHVARVGEGRVSAEQPRRAATRRQKRDRLPEARAPDPGGVGGERHAREPAHLGAQLQDAGRGRAPQRLHREQARFPRVRLLEAGPREG